MSSNVLTIPGGAISPPADQRGDGDGSAWGSSVRDESFVFSPERSMALPPLPHVLRDVGELGQPAGVIHLCQAASCPLLPCTCGLEAQGAMELVAPTSAVAQQTVVSHARQAEAIEGQILLFATVRDPRGQQQSNQLLDEILPLRTAHLRVAQIVEPQGWRYRPCSCIVHGARCSRNPQS